MSDGEQGPGGRPPRTGPTGAGWAVAAGSVVLVGAGLALAYPTLVGIGLAGVLALAVAGAVALLPSRFTATRTVTPDRVTVGAPTLARLEVRNTGPLPSPGFTAAELVDGRPLRIRAAGLARRGRRLLHYPVPTSYRGLVRLGPVVVERTDPLGLVRRAAPLTGTARLWVRPRTHPARALPVGVVLDFEGRLADNAQRGSTAFSSLREYQPGDDPRQIHWRSTARTGTLTVRERVDTNEPTLTLVLDTRPEVVSAAAFEAAVEVAASVSVASARTGHRVGLAASGEDRARVAADGGHHVLDRLAALGRHGTGGTAALLALARSGRGGTLLLVATPGAELTGRLGALRRRYGRVVLVLIDEARGAGPAGVVRHGGGAVVTAGTAADAVAGWNRLAGGAR